MDYLAPVDLARPKAGDLYDELPLWSAPFGLMLLERVPLGPALAYLDVGAGTGFVALELAERCGPGARVIAVDPWGAALARLRRKLAQRGLANVSVLEQDAAALDLPAGSVDVIVSNLGIQNFADAGAVLRACCRVAKPGAPLLTTTNLSGHFAEFYDVYRGVLAELGRQSRLPALEERVGRRGTVASVTRLLEAAGFEVSGAEVREFKLRFASGSAFLRHYFIRLGFMDGFKAIAAGEGEGQGPMAATFELLERRLNERARAHGELALTVPAACFEARKPLRAGVRGAAAAGRAAGQGGTP